LALSRWPGLLPNNFSAAYALAFCGGVYLTGATAWWLPMGALILSSTLLNWLHYDVPVFNGYVLWTYAAFAVLIGLGRLFRRALRRLSGPRLRVYRGLLVLGGGFLGAVIFYVITNTISWIFEPTQPYPKTLAGWWQAMTVGTAGWPHTWTFFRNTLLSGGLFSGLFAASMSAVEFKASKEESEAEPDSEGEPEPVPEGAPGKPKPQEA
jgi:hypothetical protein